MGDKTWVFKFPYSEDGKLVVKAAFVCTFKNEGAKYDLSVNNANRMVLSVRHASLLAIETMNKITNICVTQNPPAVMLTPLCGACLGYLGLPKRRGGKKKPRMFGLMPMQRLLYIVITEALIGDALLPYFPEITMTFDQTTLFTKLHSVTCTLADGTIQRAVPIVITNINLILT